jgi:rhodanese-related sulfurtransferase
MSKRKSTPYKLQPYMLLLPVALVITLLIALQLGTGFTAAPSATVARVQPAEYVSNFANTSHILLDVRTPEEFSSGHIAGAVNISVETLNSRLSEVPTDATVVVYCRSGRRSAEAVQILQAAGYQTIYDLGGIQTWQAEGYTVVQ